MFDPKKYFDAAASTPLNDQVRLEMIETMDLWGNENSKHACGFLSRKSIDDSLDRISKVLKVSPDQIFPTYSGTDANRKVIWACRKRFGIKNLYCSAVEHSSISDEINKTNYFDPTGNFDDIDKKAQFIALMQANSETGRIYEAKNLRQKFPNAVILQDACQSFPKNIKPDYENADAITFAPQKFYGPKMVGLVWLKNPQNFTEISKDSHTKNPFIIAGMARSFEEWANEIEKTIPKLQKWQEIIETYFIEKFGNEVIIHEKDAPRTLGTINIAFKGIRGSELMTVLSDEESICVSTGSACNSDFLSPTKTIKFIQKNPDYQFPIRISLHKFLDDEAVTDFCEIVEHYVLELKKRNFYHLHNSQVFAFPTLSSQFFRRKRPGSIVLKENLTFSVKIPFFKGMTKDY
ncbi:MAG: aminotransferase class V-fold PLP-dependent enzyme [Candidatus Peregrinibacteria bacterium]|nr:aminotransferase class V-fold PLP-dependent enzyme [Candidatus Peregrinibacteria bacterium]